MAKGPTLFSDLPSLDPSRHETEMLNELLKRESPQDTLEETETSTAPANAAETSSTEAEKKVDVRQALQGGPLVQNNSDRDRLRLLILTRDRSVLEEGSMSARRLTELARGFAEVHLIVLCLRGEGAKTTIRLGERMWVYSTNSRYWWRSGFDAYRIAREQLRFAQGFRADLIVAEDPFESGLSAYAIATKYERPLQIHVYDDLYDPSFPLRDEANRYRLLAARFVLAHADSVRTRTVALRNEIVKKYADIEPYIEVLPAYHNLSAWRDFEPTTSLRERYPQFNFIMLHVTHMTPLSHTDVVLRGVARLLTQYPSLGLIIVGNGPYREVYEKLVVALGLQNQIIFEPMPQEIISYMKSANILVHLSEDPEEEELVIQAAAAKLPMVASTTGIAGELFTDGQSALLSVPTSAEMVESNINRFLNENQLRATFEINALETVFSRIEQNFDAYVEAYQASIERSLATSG